MEMSRGWGMGDKSRAGSRVPSGAGAVSVERGDCPESSTCPWGVGLKSEGEGVILEHVLQDVVCINGSR